VVEVTTTVTARLFPTEEQAAALTEYLAEYTAVLNHISHVAFESQCQNFRNLHDDNYYNLRRLYRLGSQATISAEKEVVAKYKTVHARVPKNGRWKSYVRFRKHTTSLVYARDYSLKFTDGEFTASLQSLNGRIKGVPVNGLDPDLLNDESTRIGTATLNHRRGKWILHVPVTRDIPTVDISEVSNVVGVDMGIRHLAVTYDSRGKTHFYRGGEVKNKRAHYKSLRTDLQRKGTPSSRRRLRAIGSRESRWMRDVNHVVSKALVEQAGDNALIIVEDLTGIRNATERVKLKHRYVQVSWAFFDLRRKIEYKAALAGSCSLAVDPRYTSQMCPKCGHTDPGNRNKKAHIFTCRSCGYRSNDDRIGAMNLHNKGIQYRVQCELGIPDSQGCIQPAHDAPSPQGGSVPPGTRFTAGQEQTPSVRAG